MSVSFYAELSPIVGHRVHCMCDAVEGITFGDYQDAAAMLGQLRDAGTSLEGCTGEWCAIDGLMIEVMEEAPSPSLNVNSTNARLLLDSLGIMDEDLSGGMDANDFLARVLVAQGLALADAGRPARDNSLPGRKTQFIDCGRSVGYLQDRLVPLHEIAEFGVRTGREICWA